MNGKEVPENQRPQLIATKEVSGPVPEPETIEHYNRIYPGAAEIIFGNWTKQVDHRLEIEKTVIDSDIRRARTGMRLGFIIAMTAIVGGIVVAWNGQTFFGGSVTFTGLALIVAAFVSSRFRKPSKEN